MIDFLDMDNNKMVISEFYENDTAGKSCSERRVNKKRGTLSKYIILSPINLIDA